MNLIVDSSVWSFVLRRREFDRQQPFVAAFRSHVSRGDAVLLIGPVLAEILDGMRTDSEFERLREAMSPFPILALTRDTYVAAARLKNHCRAKGVQGSMVDCLIAATCIEGGYPLLTADRDFVHIAKHSDLILLPPLV